MKLASKLQSKLRSADGLAISDYGFGVTSPAAVKQALRMKRASSVTTLDARYRLDAYADCGITAATPHEAGVASFHHTNIGRDMAGMGRFGRATLKKKALETPL